MSENQNLFSVSKNEIKEEVKGMNYLYKNKLSFASGVEYEITKDLIKEYKKSIRRYVKYKNTENSKVMIDINRNKIHNIKISFINPKDKVGKFRKTLIINDNELYIINGEPDDECFEVERYLSRDKELEALVRPFYNYINKEIENIIGKEVKQNKPITEQFKKRFFN
jgi:hypothetical protein